MNFFKSILLDDSEPPTPENPHESGADSKLKSPQEDGNAHESAQDDNAEVWSFGGLIKTLATRSESVIETYRRDLQEFGSGLRKETETIREVASRAVKDLPASLEAGTSAAHGVLDGVLKSTADIIAKEAQVFASDGETEVPETNRGLNSGRYSWFEAQLNAIQSDLNTFCEEPEDVEDYKKWKLGFDLEDKNDEVEDLIGENGILEGVYKKVVPNVVDHESFWCRYFYRVDKIKQQEKVRADLVKRAIADNNEDDLSWDVDDDEKDGNGDDSTSGVKAKGGDEDGDMKVSDGSLNPVEKLDGANGRLRDGKDGGVVNADDEVKNDAVEPVESVRGYVSPNEKDLKSDEVGMEKIDDKMKYDGSVKKNENIIGEKSEKSEVPVVAKLEDEEDLGWDEIGDIGSDEENKTLTISRNDRPNRAGLRKHLNAAEDDEDLSWDIEDDDEPVKT